MRITDEQIISLRAVLAREATCVTEQDDYMHLCATALSGRGRARRYARARLAEILNSRRQGDPSIDEELDRRCAIKLKRFHDAQEVTKLTASQGGEYVAALSAQEMTARFIPPPKPGSEVPINEGHAFHARPRHRWSGDDLTPEEYAAWLLRLQSGDH